MFADIVVKKHCDVSLVVSFSPFYIYSNNIIAYYANVIVSYIVNYLVPTYKCIIYIFNLTSKYSNLNRFKSIKNIFYRR